MQLPLDVYDNKYSITKTPNNVYIRRGFVAVLLEHDYSL